ncbi:MAG: hypothetical protein ACLVKO_02920 [Dysgonomonas sp.]
MTVRIRLLLQKKVVPGEYCNEKYGFCIKFPEGAFTVMEGSETDEGVILIGADTLGQLAIHRGNLNSTITSGTDLKKAYDEDLKLSSNREVTYNAFNSTNYVLMGYKNKIIFYQKTVISNGQIVTAILTYDDKAKDAYYPMIDSMFKSLR